MLPTWLAPVQVNVIPVNMEYHVDYANEIKEMLAKNDIRVDADLRDEKLSYKMRESQIRKIPFTLILGDQERDNKTISYRLFGSKETTTVSQEEFINLITNKIKNHEK